MRKTRAVSFAQPIFCAIVLSLASFPAKAAEVKQITDFGANPSGIGMYLYTPSNVAAKPAIVVNVHACHGKGTDVCSSNSAFAQQADKYGFLVVCPSAVSSDGCWDVHSPSVLTHEGGGDATGIISMVKWVVQNKNGDPDRVYVAGHSSGGMMTNVMLGSYPDVFKAGAAYAGVPFACYAQGTVDNLGWNSTCAQGKATMDGKAWGDLVRAAYPNFAGIRPRIQIWHGTKDDVVFFQNFKEAIKQWTNVFGVSEAPTTTENNALQSTWIRTRYADSSGTVMLEAIEETGQPHNLVVDAAAAIHFFGLDMPSSPVDAGAKDAAVEARLPDGGGGKGGNGFGGQASSASGTGQGGAGAGGSRDAGLASSGRGGQTADGGNGNGGKNTTGGSAGRVPAAAGGSGGLNQDAGGDSPTAIGGFSGNSAANAGGAAGSKRTGGQPASGGVTIVSSTGGSVPNQKAKSSGCSVTGQGQAESWLWLLAALACAGRLRRST